MPPEVVVAWVEASKNFVDIRELQNKVGERISQLFVVDAALVTTGAAGAILLGTVAAINRSHSQQIPDAEQSSEFQNEIILQRSHHSEYDSQLLTPNTKLIEVETLSDLEAAITPRTALLFFMNYLESAGQIGRADWIKLARRHNVPTLLDASADVPPLERISEYTRLGFDMIAVSGGKAMRGPNDTGLLLGRREFIEVARQNTSPNEPTIGRVLKVGKEDTMALLAAVERFVTLDHKAEWAEMERRIAVIEHALDGIPSVVCQRIVPPISNHQPHLIIDWDAGQIRLSVEQVTQTLKANDPPIHIGRVAGTGDRGILISVLALQAGEIDVVADCLRAIFTGRH